jgi:hypothetical protein
MYRSSAVWNELKCDGKARERVGRDRDAVYDVIWIVLPTLLRVCWKVGSKEVK